MNLISRDESGGFAPIRPYKKQKLDRKTDKGNLAINSYDLANKYFDASTLLFKKSFEFIPVVLTNISFSCELYLKALLHVYGTDFGNHMA